MNTFLNTDTLLALDFVTLAPAGRTAPAVMDELHGGLVGLDVVTDPDGFRHDLIKRHARGPACLDADVALIHARTVAVDRFVLAAGRSSEGVLFDEAHPAIRLVFLIGAPAGEIQEYLRRAALLVRLVRRPGFKKALLAAVDSDAFRSVWVSAQEREEAFRQGA
ncbi:MAG TPA: PTS sugar transporter subunit IIA [Rariglobus sp.]